MVRAGDTFAAAMNTILTLQDVASARTFYAARYWRSDTLYMLLRAWAERRRSALRFVTPTRG
jgi:hypothetical protein